MIYDGLILKMEVYKNKILCALMHDRCGENGTENRDNEIFLVSVEHFHLHYI